MWQEDTHVQLRVAPDHQDTNTFNAHIQTILGGYLVLKPTHTQYTFHIQPKNLISSEKSQRNLEREEIGS